MTWTNHSFAKFHYFNPMSRKVIFYFKKLRSLLYTFNFYELIKTIFVQFESKLLGLVCFNIRENTFVDKKKTLILVTENKFLKEFG